MGRIRQPAGVAERRKAGDESSAENVHWPNLVRLNRVLIRVMLKPGDREFCRMDSLIGKNVAINPLDFQRLTIVPAINKVEIDLQVFRLPF